MNKLIDIILPVYNGEGYLEEQLNSISKQSFQDFRLIVRDDGSEDKTKQISKSFGESCNFEFCFMEDKHQGITAGVNQMLAASESPYIMFCDQDDAWFPEKLERALEKMHESERKFGKETPLLVFTDLCVVDEELNIINNSYYKYQNIKPENCTLNRLLTQNVASACTMLINRSLAKSAGQIPANAVMHDHWFNLVAAAFGEMVYLNESTLYYRQHKNNILGASVYSWSYFYKRYRSGLDRVKERFYLNVEQAKEFVKEYEAILSADDIRMLTEFANLRQKNWLERRKILFKNKIYKSGWRRNIGTMLIL